MQMTGSFAEALKGHEERQKSLDVKNSFHNIPYMSILYLHYFTPISIYTQRINIHILYIWDNQFERVFGIKCT